MITATFLPFAVAMALVAQPPFTSGLSALFGIIGAPSEAHVASTADIPFNLAHHVGALLTLIGIRQPLLIATFTTLLPLPLWISMVFMLVYIRYGRHFARQNPGLPRFVSRISVARSVVCLGSLS
jgi:hypothetical protein